MFFDNILKIVLNILYKIWAVRLFKFINSCLGWYFKFLVFKWILYFFPCTVEILRLDYSTYLSLLFKYILSARLSINLRSSEVLIFFEVLRIIYILFYIYIDFLLYFFLVTSFDRYNEETNFLILFSKFSNVLPDFTYASAIGILCSICFRF